MVYIQIKVDTIYEYLLLVVSRRIVIYYLYILLQYYNTVYILYTYYRQIYLIYLKNELHAFTNQVIVQTSYI